MGRSLPGVLVRGRRKKRDGWGMKKPTLQPKDDWISAPVNEALRIVPEPPGGRPPSIGCRRPGKPTFSLFALNAFRRGWFGFAPDGAWVGRGGPPDRVAVP